MYSGISGSDGGGDDERILVEDVVTCTIDAVPLAM